MDDRRNGRAPFRRVRQVDPTLYADKPIRLRDASPSQIAALARAKEWVLGPDTLTALRDRHSIERQRISIIDSLVAPGSIDVLVDLSIPKGYVIPRGRSLIVLKPQTVDEPVAPPEPVKVERAIQAHVPEYAPAVVTASGCLAILVIAAVVVVIAWGVLSVLFAAFG